MISKLSQLDHKATAFLQGKPRQLRFVMLCASFLGLPMVTAAVVAVGLGVSFGVDNRPITIALLLCFIAIGINMLLKLILQRARPETLYANNMRFKTYSFPSGHSFSAFVLYGLSAHLASEYLLQPWALMAVVGLIVLILMVGLSRVYLGAHYVLDVLGGWVLGVVMLWAIIVSVHP